MYIFCKNIHFQESELFFRFIRKITICIIFGAKLAPRSTGSWGTQIRKGIKKLQKVPVGGSASWRKCQLDELE